MKTRLGMLLTVVALGLGAADSVAASEHQADAPQSEARERARESSRAASVEAIARLRAETRIELPAPRPTPRATVSGD